MNEKKNVGQVSPPVTDSEAMQKRLEEGKVEEDKKREADKKTPWGVKRNP
jgi:hypothetical protein